MIRLRHNKIELALHEVCVNVVDHAYGGGPGELTVAGTAADTTVELRVTDTGGAFEFKPMELDAKAMTTDADVARKRLDL